MIMTVIDNIKEVSKCCGENLWKTSSFATLRHKLSEKSLNNINGVGVCQSCESFFLIAANEIEGIDVHE